jgi:hypothetical protein
MGQTSNQTQTQPKLVGPKLIEKAKKVLTQLEARGGEFNSIMLVKEFIDNVERPISSLRITDALNVCLWRLLPRTVRMLVSIKQHLSDLYRNGYHINIIISPDCHKVETPKSVIQFLLMQYNEIHGEFKRTTTAKTTAKYVDLTLTKTNEIAKEVFEMIGMLLVDFKNDAIDYKLVSLIAKHAVSESSYTVILYD